MFEQYKMVYSYMNESAPTPKTYFVDVPFGDGTLDLTEAFSTIPFNNVDCMISFGITKNNDTDSYKNKFIGDFSGKKVNIQIDEEEYIRRGRIIAIDFEDTVSHLGINCSIIREPYRLKEKQTSVKINVNGTQIVKLENEQKKAEIKVITSGTVTIKNGTNSYTYNKGTHILPYVLLPGSNQLEITGTNISIEFLYQEGVL